MKSPSLPLMLLVCAALIRPAQAQVHEAWIARHTLSTTGTNQAVAVALDQDGNIIVGGHGTSTNGDFDYVVLKLDSSGKNILGFTSPNAGTNRLFTMGVTPEGSVAVSGSGGTLMVDPEGQTVWTTPHEARALVVGKDGDIYLTGFEPNRYATARLDSQTGTNVWVRYFKYLNDPNRIDSSQVIIIDGHSNVVVSGWVHCYFDRLGGYGGRMSMSYDSNGNLRWRGEPFPQECLSYHVSIVGIGVDRHDNTYTVGNLDGGGRLFSVFKESTTGGLNWVATPINAGAEGATASITDANGNTFVTGRRIKNNPNVVFQSFKVSSEGVALWTAQYLGPLPGYHRANAIALDSAGNAYVTGQSPGIDTGNDYATIKYSSTGQELWVQRYDGPAHGDDVATAIAVAPDGSVYVTGWSTTRSNLVEITTIKYTQPESASLTVETNRTVSLEFPGTPGATNRVQATTDFLDWLELGFSITDTNGLIHFLDTNAPNYPFRFYRTVTP